MLQRFLTTYNRPLFQVWLLRTISLTWKHEKLEAKLLTALFHTAKNSSSGYKIQNNLKDCYNLLNVHDDCTEEELKEAYIRLAKIYHPDSQSETADPKKFGQVKEAYKAVKVNENNSSFLLLLTLLHSEWPKLYGVLAILSAIGLRWMGTHSGQETLLCLFLSPF